MLVTNTMEATASTTDSCQVSEPVTATQKAVCRQFLNTHRHRHRHLHRHNTGHAPEII